MWECLYYKDAMEVLLRTDAISESNFFGTHFNSVVNMDLGGLPKCSSRPTRLQHAIENS
jgi:hypothetical protein